MLVKKIPLIIQEKHELELEMLVTESQDSDS